MPNLILTTACNRRCPYCFALDTMEGGARQMGFGEIVDLADRALASGLASLGLLGGEPTLHPEFADIVRYLVRRGLGARVFTNALLPVEGLDELRGSPRNRLTFIVNVNAPEIETPGNHERQRAFVRHWAGNTDLGANLYRPDLDLSFLVDFVRDVDLADARIRLGFAQPIVGEANEYLEIGGYRRLAGAIVALAEAVFERHIRLSFDCGFPLCAFTDAQLGSLFRRGASLKFVCTAAVDIAPGGQAWGCFPLARETCVSYDASKDLKELGEGFVRWNRDARARLGPGIFPECGACPHRALGQCDGGCLAHLLVRSPPPS